MIKNKWNLLVVDDEEPYFLKVRSLLPLDEFEVNWAQNRAAALERMEKRRADLIVLDLRLSDRSDDESGIDLLRELRRKWPSTQVIVFTRFVMQPDKIIECIKGGAYYYFRKEQFGTDPGRFVTLVSEALAYRPKHDILEDNYPHPLALLYRDYRRNVVAPYMKFTRMIELTELLVKLSSVIALVTLHSESGPAMDSRASLMRPSFGKWFEFLQSAMTVESRQSSWLSNLRKVFTTNQRRTISGLIQIRNEWGHGATRPEHEYAQIIQQWDGAVMELLNAASILSVWQFFVVRSSKLQANRIRLHTVVNIGGHNPRFLLEELALPVECEADKVYVYNPETDECICLDPFVGVFVCEVCNQETVFIYDKADRDRVLYLDYASGHRSSKSEPFASVQNVLTV